MSSRGHVYWYRWADHKSLSLISFQDLLRPLELVSLHCKEWLVFKMGYVALVVKQHRLFVRECDEESET